MADERIQIKKVVSKLIELTQKGKLHWETTSWSPPNSTPHDKIVSNFFTEYCERIFAIYEILIRFVVEDNRRGYLGQAYASQIVFGRPIDYDWRREIHLVILNKNQKLLWTFPEFIGIEDLIEEVRYQTAAVPELISEILKDE